MTNNVVPLRKTSNNEEFFSQFRAVAEKVSAITARHGVTVKPYRSSELPLFRQLSFEAQGLALSQLNTFLKSLELFEDQEENLGEQDRALWYALSAFGLLPNSDMFKLFKSSDVVEIYDMEGFQIWRNFNFLKICSYNLEEMYSIEWFRRYERKPEDVKACGEAINDLLTGKTPEISMVQVPYHQIRETDSSEQLHLGVTYQWIARLKDRSGQLAAWMVCSSVEILDAQQSSLEATPPAFKLHLIEDNP